MTARIYVGTYAKYNSGSIKGAWLDLEDFSDKDAFLEACRELHKDESDPEFMFQDFEGFPKAYYNESSVSDELWAWLELDESDRELLAVYTEHVDSDGDIDRAREAYCGKYDTEAEWAEDWLTETGGLEGVPEHLKNYIDYESYARDARLGGDMVFVRHDGDLWVFYGNV
ncbi:antirestriction protein ArdA [Bradyrhizobium elkanii]|uniref:antirestriction protein ArdA n=1 Tax=Bradyrhizobium elkanii TaxID=29448 RepID=UPI002729BE09|nr:antirestriction protein ArdA [Bradyrhizobium elkanii]WLA80309.1 antirestriction protein ArdA [Bradyrhizobium elkanii]